MMVTGLNQNAQLLGQLIGTGLGLYGRSQERAQQKEDQLAAANLLTQSYQLMETDPEASQAAFIQAQQLAPEFVLKAVQGLASQGKASAQPAENPLTEYQRQSLELRRQQQEIDRLKMQRAEETNTLRQQQLQAQIDKLNADMEAKKTEAEGKEGQAVEQMDETINLLDRMLVHPGLEAATGLTSPLSNIPGTKARGFRALLDTLKGQQFLNEVQALKGMGQLSNAEGDKLAAAAASLDLGMPTDEFVSEVKRIRSTLESARNTKAGTYTKGDQEQAPSGNIVNWSDL